MSPFRTISPQEEKPLITTRDDFPVSRSPPPQSVIIPAINFRVITDFLGTLSPKATVLWDVDNTLTFFPDDEFFTKYSIHNRELHTQFQLFKKWLYETFGAELGNDLLQKASLRSRRDLPNKKIPSLLSQLASHGVSSLPITAAYGGEIQGVSNPDERINAEKKLGLDFEKLSSHTQPVTFPLMPDDDYCPRQPVAIGNELFCSNVPKDRVLDYYWSIVGRPQEVVFIDDCEKNLIDVQRLCQRYKIKFTGFHYMEIAEKYSAPFDEELAKFKFETLFLEDIWLTDSAARLRMSIQTKIKEPSSCHCIIQ